MPLSRILRPIRAFWRVSSVAIIVAGLALIFCTRGFYVYGSCMEPNLYTGERVLASRVNYWFGSPKRGDVIIFRYPGDPTKNFVKRVIGLPGDRVEIRNGQLFVNNKPAPEPYKQIASHGDFGPEKVTPGSLFVLGDNRDQSNDSRYWGELPMQNVEAKALVLYWPMNRVHIIN